MKAYRVCGICCVAMVFVLGLLLPRAAGGAGYSFLDDFEDGDTSDWTMQTSVTGSIGASMARSFGGIFGLQMKSIPRWDRSCVFVNYYVSNVYYTKAYTVGFEFNYDKSNDPNGFHFIEVMAMNDAAGVARQVGLYLDTPGQAGGQDALVYRDAVPSNQSVAGLTEDVWYRLDVAVDPSSGTYDLTVTDPQGTFGVYDTTVPQWVNQLVTADIPFIGAGQADGFACLRVGDRNADAVTYDHGQAYWDNIAVQGTQIPEPVSALILLVGFCPAVLRRWKRR